MAVGGYRFRPRRWPTLVTLLLLPLLVSLGFWQLDRADQKRALQASLERGRAAPPLDLNSGQPDYASAVHRRVVANGRYDAGHQILIDNQLRDLRQGYQVLTPLLLEDTAVAVLVDRGWVPASADRAELPDLGVPEQPRRVEGVLDKGPSVGLRLGPFAEPGQGWPLRVQYLDFPALSEALPYRILPYLIRLDPAAADGYRRDWQPVRDMGPETHVGYAVQWFALAATLLAIFVAVNLKRERKSD